MVRGKEREERGQGVKKRRIDMEKETGDRGEGGGDRWRGREYYSKAMLWSPSFVQARFLLTNV